MIAAVFSLMRSKTVRRPAARPRWTFGGERLEQRIALAVTQGELVITSIGTSSNTGNINTATSFTLNLFSTAGTSGYFSGLPIQSLGSSTTFNITAPGSLSFGSGQMGNFTSTSFTEISNVPGSRSFYVLGNFTPGTLGPLTPNPAPASFRLNLTQTPAGTGSQSAGGTLSIPPETRQYLVAANDLGCDSVPRTYVIDAYTGAVANSFLAYADPSDSRFRGGVRVAIGDVDGDPTTQEVVTAPGPGRVGEVRVFDAVTGVEKPSFRFRPFGNSYTSGIELAVGDVDGDGVDDVVAAASTGRGSVVTGLSTKTAFVADAQRSFTAFAAPYNGGATVAVPGVNRIVVGSGLGMRPTVRTYDVSGPKPTFTQFLPSLPTGTGGVAVSAQRFVAGNPQIMVSGGTGAASRIGVFNNQVNPPIRSYNNFASRPRPNSPVYAAASSLLGGPGGVVDTVFQTQGRGGVGGILKANPTTGVVDPTFAPTYNGRLISGPLRIATRSPQTVT